MLLKGPEPQHSAIDEMEGRMGVVIDLNLYALQKIFNEYPAVYERMMAAWDKFETVAAPMLQPVPAKINNEECVFAPLYAQVDSRMVRVDVVGSWSIEKGPSVDEALGELLYPYYEFDNVIGYPGRHKQLMRQLMAGIDCYEITPEGYGAITLHRPPELSHIIEDIKASVNIEGPTSSIRKFLEPDFRNIQLVIEMLETSKSGPFVS